MMLDTLDEDRMKKLKMLERERKTEIQDMEIGPVKPVFTTALQK